MTSNELSTEAGHWVLVVNGELPAVAPQQLAEQLAKADRIVAVDGGLHHCVTLGLWPTVLIGDLDSTTAELIADANERDVAIHTFPADKDATDLELALELACESGANELTVVAAFGGRLDHELATVSLLASDRWRSMKISATDGTRRARVVHDECTLQLELGATVSLLPWHGQVTGVTTQGLQWPLTDATLAPGTTHGVSNVAVEPTQHITITGGVLLVVADPTAA